MKKTILTIIAAVSMAVSFGQTSIEYKNYNMLIRVNAIDEIGNQLRYDVTCPIEYLDLTQDLLSITMKCKDGECSYSSTISVPDLPTIYKMFFIENTDLGKRLDYARERFGANLIMGNNLLKLDSNWSIKSK
jgi:hypothetical protein